MMTLRCERSRPAPQRTTYNMVQAKAYYVRFEQLWNGSYGDPIPAGTVTSTDDGKWRTVISVDDGTETEFNIYVGDDEPVDRVYVMNTHGKTIDTIV